VLVSKSNPESSEQPLLPITEPDTDNLPETSSRLERMAYQLAAQHRIDPHPVDSGRPTLIETQDLASRLEDAHQHFVSASVQDVLSSSAAEWLLDNYYMVVQTLQQIEEDLPEGYYRQLPKLAAADPTAPDPHTGRPRVYAAACVFLTHEGYQLDQGRLSRFVTAYQQVEPFTMGELWAMPTVLRLALLETLADAAMRSRGLAADSRGMDGTTAPTDSAAVLNENDVVGNCIVSLRRVNSQDWNRFFEGVSLVQQILSKDAAGIYARMDFASRDRYRGVVESLARATGRDESAVAQKAIDLTFAYQAGALSAATNGVDTRVDHEDPGGDQADFNLDVSHRAHVGYYLFEQGRAQLENAIGYRPRGKEGLRRQMVDHPTLVYLGGIGLLAGLIVAAFVAYTGAAGGGLAWQIVAGLLSLIPALTLAVSLVNGMVSRLLDPRILPKLDFKDGIPAACRTMVVVPCMIASEFDITSLTNQLELHYLRNTDPNLSFALLSDFADADQAEMPEDAGLVALAQAHIEELNAKYSTQPFYLFHRRRQWNSTQRIFMGWERKRGKLQEFNRLLRGHTESSFTTQVGHLSILPQIRYVITLDADTILPRGEADRLVGTLAHPLNRAEFDAETGKVCAGYTVLQPRTAIKPTSANQSLFTRVFTGDRGIDLYTRAVSDVYQDLFGAGIFVGKGIYEVDTFERSLAGRLPENAILSHDLFEGIHGRVGLVTDILLYEEYPPHYLINVLRSYRWVRGDWQLLPWLLPRVPAENGSIPNDLSIIDRWKILDNLRRSLSAAALMALLIAGWTVLPGAAWVWTLFAVLTPAIPPLLNTTLALIHGVQNASWQAALRPVRDDSLRWLLFIAFLPYESQLMLVAIVTTLRRLITRRNLLQWTTAAHTVRIFGDEATSITTLVKMLPSTLAVAALAILVGFVNFPALLIAAPFFLLWLSAAQIAHWISRPTLQKPADLTADQVQQLRTLARRTWLFYEHFVGPDGNWLPPDHFQESPRGVVAQRTSPTNIGLYLLTVLAAYDLGYVGMTNMAVRLYATFSTLGRMNRYRGHFLNWIDTRTLETLPPAYVSTVDSGNLAASLIAFKQGCVAMPQQAVWRWEVWQGLSDLLLLLAESAPARLQADARDDGAAEDGDLSTSRLLAHISQIRDQIEAVQSDPAQWQPLLTRLITEEQPAVNQQLVDLLEANVGTLNSEVLQNCRIYINRIQHHLNEMQHEVSTLLPWLAMLNAPPALFAQPSLSPDLAESWADLQRMLPLTPRLDQIETICTAGQAQAQHLSAQIAAETIHDGDADASTLQCAGVVRAPGGATTNGADGSPNPGRELCHPGPICRRIDRRHGLRLSLRRSAAALSHWLQCGRQHAGSELLRPARLRSAHRQPGRHCQMRCAPKPLDPPGATVDASR
jgi:cyclic beta-1,2-glucan synthetase